MDKLKRQNKKFVSLHDNTEKLKKALHIHMQKH